MTHTRYYVILFGVFAAVAGILLSFLPVRKNGVIAAMLIVFAVVSIVPPVDAFTISRSSQTETLKNVLLQNKMLENNTIMPNASISDKDKQTITNAINYLSMMEYIDRIEWLPVDFNSYNYDDFYDTFGFNPYEKPGNINQSIYLNLEEQTPIEITGYDTFVSSYVDEPFNEDMKIGDFEKSGKNYTLIKSATKDQVHIKLIGENSEELISFKTKEIFDKFSEYNSTKGLITTEEATFTKENEQAKMTIVVQNITIEKSSNRPYNGAAVYIFVKIK